MLCFPNAKINLGLNIIEKRPDGFHNIETIFYPIPLCDALEITKINSNKVYEFSSSGISVNVKPSENIVIKAFELVASKFDIPPTAIHLHKNIPFGAGLGGGSSDAAHMIKLLNSYYELNLNNSELENLAIQIGSDCPFFINNDAVFAEGKGNLFTPTDLNLCNYYILLIKPDIHISTPMAYANVNPKKTSEPLYHRIKQPIDNWKHCIQNDFEKSIFPNHPELKTIKDELYAHGAVYASMSGSGSSMFGLFKKMPEIKESWQKYFIWTSKL